MIQTNYTTYNNGKIQFIANYQDRYRFQLNLKNSGRSFWLSVQEKRNQKINSGYID